ncbi:MAG TPA: hypothetical protein VKA91_04760 [Nitrososphaeraceae archaeon]|nr:hypothetical protein [Nitrososphaeraceae archaeon]
MVYDNDVMHIFILLIFKEIFLYSYDVSTLHNNEGKVFAVYLSNVEIKQRWGTSGVYY